MKTIKKYMLPVIVGIISSIIPTVLGYEVDTWQYWWIALPMIFMSWIIYPLHQEIVGKQS